MRNGLHVEERMEEWVDELSRHLHESRQFSLEGGVDIFIFIGGNFEVLLKLFDRTMLGAWPRSHYEAYLEKVLLVVERLLLLVPELCERVIIAIVINELQSIMRH